MNIKKIIASSAALMMGMTTVKLWAETPPMNYKISPQRVAVFDIANHHKKFYAAGERGVLLSASKQTLNDWKSQRLPTTDSVMGIAFGDSGKGVLVGHGGMIQYTEDDGISWHPVDVSDHSRGDPFMDVAYLGQNRFLAVGAFGLVMHSVDGGKHWNPLTISEDYFDRHLYSIVKADNDWLLIGESGSLFVGLDNATHWQSLTSPYEGSFFGGMQTPEGAWLFYGMRGQVWRTSDRGATWQQSKLNIRTAINAHGLGDEGEVYLFGNGGRVLVSKDDGQHFSPASRSGLPGDITSAVRINGEWLIASTAGISRWDSRGDKQ